MGNPRRQPPQAGELLGLDQGRLGLAEVMLEADDPLPRAKPDPQLVPVERLGQEIIGAGLHALDQVLLLGFRRQEDGIDIAGPLGRADPPDQSRAVQLGHHPVGDDHGEEAAIEEAPGLGPVLGRRHLVPPLLEVVLKQPPRDRIVVRDQDLHLHPRSLLRHPCLVESDERCIEAADGLLERGPVLLRSIPVLLAARHAPGAAPSRKPGGPRSCPRNP